jgi:hypothetical protein
VKPPDIIHVTPVALLALRERYGEPSAEPPTGAPTLMGYPIRVHEPCADPTCVLCTGQSDIVFGKPSRFSP